MADGEVAEIDRRTKRQGPDASLDLSGFIEGQHMPTTIVSGEMVSTVGIQSATFDRAVFEINSAAQPLDLRETCLVAIGIIDPMFEKVR